jgi:hypothetical protein
MTVHAASKAVQANAAGEDETIKIESATKPRTDVAAGPGRSSSSAAGGVTQSTVQRRTTFTAPVA